MGSIGYAICQWLIAADSYSDVSFNFSVYLLLLASGDNKINATVSSVVELQCLLWLYSLVGSVAVVEDEF